ncbi:MAG: hypothetical protein ACTSV1_06725 [Alphaproteobacteria bacterium]
MPSITPPPPPSLQATLPLPPPVVVVQNPPPGITQLSLGHVLEAALIAQVGKDLYTLKTPLGQLTVQTVLGLPKLANLVLHLQSLSPQAQFLINSINGKPPEATLRSGAPPGQPPGASAGNTTAGATPLTVGSTLQASLLRPLGQPAAAPPQTAGTAETTAKTGVPTGAVASLTAGLKNTIAKGIGTLAGRALPTAQAAKTVSDATTAPRQSVQASKASTVSRGSQASHSQQAVGKGSHFLSTGSHFGVKIGKIVLPSPAATDATTQAVRSPTGGLAVGRSLTGTVTGTTTTGHPIVQTNSGVIALRTPATLPRGSVLTLEITSPPVPPKTDPGFHPGAERQNMFISRQWPALDEALATFQEVTPVTAQNLLQTVIPRPGPVLTATIMFFLTALRGGDMRGWLGDPQIRTIERNRPNLLGRLRDDFKTLGRIADEAAGADWRVALIPINTGAALEQIRMLMRHGGEDEEEDGDKSDTRFIIDVVLSRMGRIQLDGLVRGEGKKLDLIVRSQTPFEETMRKDIQEIFRAASEASGLTGGVGFQAAPPNFIDIADPISDDELGLVV